MCFQTNLILPISGNTIEETTLLAAFDRETGAYIPTAALFSCPGLEIGERLLDLAKKDGWPDTPDPKWEMPAAFRPEYIAISSDGLRAILHPWAIPGAADA